MLDVETSPQAMIERRMAEVIALGNYEAAYLFSQEGLPMAQARKEAREETPLVKISMLLREVRNTAAEIAGLSRLREIVVEGGNKKMVFRFFHAFDQEVVLVVVVPKGKAYRQHTNRLEKMIAAFSLD